jgi:hypothetical protein
MESESSLLCSEESVIGPCPEPDKSAHNLVPYFTKVHFSIIFPYMLKSQKGLSYSGFLTKFFFAFLISSVFVIWPIHPIFPIWSSG